MVIFGLYRDNGKENGNYYLVFRMINKPPPFKGLNIRIPIGFILVLGFRVNIRL